MESTDQGGQLPGLLHEASRGQRLALAPEEERLTAPQRKLGNLHPTQDGCRSTERPGQPLVGFDSRENRTGVRTRAKNMMRRRAQALALLQLLKLSKNEHPALRTLLRSLRDVGTPNHASSIRKKHLTTRYTADSVPSALTM